MWKPSVVTLTALFCASSNTIGAYRPGDERADLLWRQTALRIDGFTDPSGDFSTNKTFFFQVFPTQQQPQQAKKKLLVYFQGGGACTDADMCNFSLQCSLGQEANVAPLAIAESTGVLNRSNPDNVFKDWDIVHIPHCSNDMHAGSADSIFAPDFGRPHCLGENITMHMSGYENSLSVLKWALANYPNPAHLVIGGSSAGSLGAQILSALVADMWKVEGSPIRFSVLADSFVGVLPKDKPAGSVVNYFGVCDVDLKLPPAVTTACKAKMMTAAELVSAAVKKIPSSNWLFINSKADLVQRSYYAAVKDVIRFYTSGEGLLSGDESYKQQAVAILETYRSVSSRIATFFVEGDEHVLTMNDGYTNTPSDSGEKLGTSLAELLDGSASPAPASTPAPSTGAPQSAAPATTSETILIGCVLDGEVIGINTMKVDGSVGI
ncbi:hypothetical protein PybrP1_009469, partial [[Pythium] brassicae (nom. inval.)]